MKKIISSVLAFIMIISSLSAFSVYAEEVSPIIKTTLFKNALNLGGSYSLERDIFSVKEFPINKNVKINGKGHSINAQGSQAGAMYYQNEAANSSFTDMDIFGCEKEDVGIWLGAGSMTYNSCSISKFNITTNRYSAMAASNSSTLTLNNTVFFDNNTYDLQIDANATVNFNGTTTLNKVRVSSNFVKINIGNNFSGSFEMTFDRPVAKAIGTVASSADISNITVSNSDFSLENRNGKLYLKAEKEPEIHFDMAQRNALYKGSTGFLYGAAEINVPSIDLLYGLKPDTMVQKAYAGKQHPTGDAIRTGSALNAAGVRDMQIYLQDNYLEWPYDAPYKNDSIDLDAYQKTVETIIYAMICDKAKQGDEGAFKGSDGSFYKLNGRGRKYSYVLFNEPDQIWYQNNLEGLERAWKRIYDAVHKIDPEARCVGPNFAGYNEYSYDAFLKYCYDNNCLPEIISWHELGDISLTDFVKHYDEIRNMQVKYYTNDYAEKSGRSYQPELLVNEYARHYDIGSVGGLVKWLAMFEDKDMSGCMAYWAMANTLNEMAADQNSPASTWWVYHWYAQMTGKQCPLVSPKFEETKFYGVASYDEDINMGYALFGGNENENGKETVYLDNTDSTGLMNNEGAVHVKIYGVGFSGQLGANYKPEAIFEGNIKAEENSLKIQINNTDEMEAYFAVLTKPEDNAEISQADNLKFPYLSYEAENAQLLGGAKAYAKGGWTDFATSGRMDVGSVNNNGDGVCFTVNVPESGYYNASIFYSLQAPYVNPKTLVPQENGQNRGIGKALPYGMELDGNRLSDITLESTVTWAYKNHCDTRLYLSEGQHKIAYKHINGNQGNKGNLQLVAALDKLTLTKEKADANDFEICLDEMSNFKEGGAYRVTAVAPAEGYYTVSADGEIEIKKQCVDYAKDAESFSECSVFDVPTGKTIYLAKGANTLVVSGIASKLVFRYEKDKTSSSSITVNSSQITLHGTNPALKKSSYAKSGYVISELGIGQKPVSNESADKNYSTFSINAPSDGIYNFAIRYTNDEPAPIMQKADGSTYIHPYNIDLVERYAQIIVNGNEAETVYFKNTLSWDTFKTVDVQLTLKKGTNKVKIYNDNSYQFSNLVNSTAPEIDCITVSKLSYDGEKAAYIKGAASVKHNNSTTSTLTKATASKDGKLVKKSVCKECGYISNSTTVIPKIASVKLNTTAYTYDGKVKKPAVIVKDSKGKTVSSANYTVAYSKNKAVGTVSAKITFKGNYSGTKTLSFKINPKGTTLSGLTAKSKGFTVKWRKQATQTTGYEIQLATDSKFTKNKKTLTVSKNGTTSKAVTKLKAKKKYYVRIRTYKTVSGKKYYSGWSKAKTATTKK